MKKYFVQALAAVALLSVASCKTDFETDVTTVQPTSGSADFTRYVALGNSLTSGYRDGALYIDGQVESYPNMLANQMKLAGGAAVFKQPLMPNNVGGFTNLGVAGKLTLQVVNGNLVPVASAPAAALDNISAGGPYQNLGVPGAKSFHLGIEDYGSMANLPTGKANPYYVRFSTGTSVIKAAVAQNPTFFTLWIGNNDVLSYATSGGVGVDRTGNVNPATYGQNDITDPNVLTQSITGYVNALTANGAKGVIANIPYVTSIPYFTRVPAKPITNLTDAQVTQLNTGYAQYNAGLLQLKNLGALTDAEYQARLIKFAPGAAVNGAVIKDKDLKDLSAYGLPSYRQTTAEDYILLTASSVLPAGGGTATPLDDQYVLTKTEAARVITATDKYNAAIASLASAKGLGLVDANTKMKQLASMSGLMYDGVRYTATFVSGGAFSLDGVHLTGRGYAVIANEFLRVINEKYGSTLPMVNPSSYSGVQFPK